MKKQVYTDGVTMEDGKQAWPTQSGDYYCRREPDIYKWTSIVYYTINKTRIRLAEGSCGACGEHLISKHCGDFVSCKCGKSYLDTDRWFPERQRYGGELQPINTLKE